METLRTDLTFEKLRKLTLTELMTRTGVNIPSVGREPISIIVVLPSKKSKVESGEKIPAMKNTDFYGMWADRTDMKDSIAWVHSIRTARSSRLYEN